MMDLKALIGTCVAVFLAEMGDKTQLAVFGAATATRRPLEVFLGATIGLVLVTLLAVVAGHLAGHLISTRWLRVVGGALFVGIGLSLLLKPNG
jgi:putative Ca2+/H+ antiporter (TMEM165/GDT1 family)